MIYHPSTLAVCVFVAFIGLTLGLSFAMGRRAKGSAGYFAAHGQIPWFVNGVAFAGDYLSAASFLGICGMIAFYGYDGFLYSIGYLAGWIVALFVVAEPMKRLGRFTFADALNAKFDSPQIKVAAGVSTLAVSVFYLIPQMVGAGALVTPLLGLPHWAGVSTVGLIVTLIVVTAGMVSTTWVQFLKGGLLILFSLVLTGLILSRGFSTPREGAPQAFRRVPLSAGATLREGDPVEGLAGARVAPTPEAWSAAGLVLVEEPGAPAPTVWRRHDAADAPQLLECQRTTRWPDGRVEANGLPLGEGPGQGTLRTVGSVLRLPHGEDRTGPLGPLEFFSVLSDSEVALWGSIVLPGPDGGATTVYFPKPTLGAQLLRPGEHPTFQGIRSPRLVDKLNFLSLMLALFGGTASLPHILIRYYTVKDEAAARKSTIVGIACIGFFYVLTLYMGLGAMTSGSLDVTDTNMAAPLLARSFSEWLFAAVSAIAFTTVLGTVSGLILASAGAVTHDLIGSLPGLELTEHQQVRVGRATAVVVGLVAVVLGILFQKLNVTYLVGWAFSVAASANLPALVMMLYWPRTTRQGVVAAVVVGMVSSLAWILLSEDTFTKVYGLPAGGALAPFSQPGIVTIPLGFLTLVVVSLLTGNCQPVRGGGAQGTQVP